MTMQIAIVATDGIVLASDTQKRVTERQFTNGSEYIPDTIINSSKLSLCQRHNVAIALAGHSDVDSSAGDMLAKHLDSLPSLSDSDFGVVLKEWGDDYYGKSRLAGAQSSTPLVALLVARPGSRFPIIKLGVNYDSYIRDSKSYAVSGHENNAGVFWPEYLQVHKKKQDMSVSTAIAAFTILTAGEINSYGIGDLEVWQCLDSWRVLSEQEIDSLKSRFGLLQEFIRKAVGVGAEITVDKKKFDALLGKMISMPPVLQSEVKAPRKRKVKTSGA
jgi:hypothetical protein